MVNLMPKCFTASFTMAIRYNGLHWDPTAAHRKPVTVGEVLNVTTQQVQGKARQVDSTQYSLSLKPSLTTKSLTAWLVWQAEQGQEACEWAVTLASTQFRKREG